MLSKFKDLFTTNFLSVKELMEQHREIIDAIKYNVSDQTIFEAQYLPCITQYAEYAYLLPASEYHHHNQKGGLFEHTLETVLGAMESYSSRGVDVRNKEQYKLKKESRESNREWKLAVFIAALIHDAGKVFTLKLWIETDGGKSLAYWNPYNNSLFDFLNKNNNFDYSIEWIEGRGTTHEWFTPILFPRIVPQKVIACLGLDKAAAIIEAVTPMTRNDNLIIGYIRDSDQHSTSRESALDAIAFASTKSSSETQREPRKPSPAKSNMTIKNPSQNQQKASQKAVDNRQKTSGKTLSLNGNAQAKTNMSQTHTQSKTVAAQPPAQENTNVSQPPAQENTNVSQPPAQEQERTTQIDTSNKETDTDNKLSRERFTTCLRKLVIEGEVVINAPERKSYILLFSNAGWANTSAIKRIIKELIGDTNSQTRKEAVNELIKNGAFMVINGDKITMKTKINDDTVMLKPIPINIMNIITNTRKLYDGNVNIHANLSFKLPKVEHEIIKDSNDKVSKTVENKDETMSKALKCIEKLIELAGNKNAPSIGKEDWDIYIKKEVGQPLAPLVKKFFKQNNITKPNGDSVKVSIARAKEVMEEYS